MPGRNFVKFHVDPLRNITPFSANVIADLYGVIKMFPNEDQMIAQALCSRSIRICVAVNKRLTVDSFNILKMSCSTIGKLYKT